MADVAPDFPTVDTDEERQTYVIETLEDAFTDLMRASPDAFRTKYRKMAADAFAFYRGTACLFYRDLVHVEDPWVDERTRRVWVHGDLHAENFGTYMNSEGLLVFDVNDFDEAYLGHYTWDLVRFVASLSLLGRRKAFPEQTVRELAEAYLRAYVRQVRRYVKAKDDHQEFALNLKEAHGPVREVLLSARLSSRRRLLDSTTTLDGDQRRFQHGAGVRVLDPDEVATVKRAVRAYTRRIIDREEKGVASGWRQLFQRPSFFEVKDVVGRSGFGIGSAGLSAYNVLIEGPDQALKNDVVLTLKQANTPAISRYRSDPEAERFFRRNSARRTEVSQLALQAHTDPFLGWATIRGQHFVVDELSPYESDLDWGDLTEPDVVLPVVEDLGRATAKIHCASDKEDSEEDLVDFVVEEAIAGVIDRDPREFVRDTVARGLTYAEVAQRDHRLFVDAFREGRIGGLASTRHGG